MMMQRCWWIFLFFMLARSKTIDSNLRKISLMSYNVMLVPSILVFDRDQMTRAKHLAAAKFLRQADILCLQEVFQREPSEILLNALEKTYPYSTPILGDDTDEDHWNETLNESIGRHSLKFVSGGVTILSKWPIVYGVQYFYRHFCSAHTFVRTGFVYGRIIYGRKKKTIHVFGTHLQPNDHRGCYVHGEDQVRREQMIELKSFIESRKFPSDELVFILGDFNIDRYETSQYEQMLEILDVLPQILHRTSVPFSWDSSLNAMTKQRHGNQLLDYVFLRRNNLTEKDFPWLNRISDPVSSEQWRLIGENSSFYDSRNIPLIELSDHYPIVGFFQGNRRFSSKQSSTLISFVRLYDEQTQRPVIVVDGYLRLGAWNQTATDFILTNNGTPRRHRCLKSNQFVFLIDRFDRNFFLSDEKFLRMKFSRNNANRFLTIIDKQANTTSCIENNAIVSFETRLRDGFFFVQNQNDRLCACTREKSDVTSFRLSFLSSQQ